MKKAFSHKAYTVTQVKVDHLQLKLSLEYFGGFNQQVPSFKGIVQ